MGSGRELPADAEAGLPSFAGTRLSIERKLPLIIGGLLVVVILALSTAAYVEVRSSAARISGERLVNVTTQFRDLFRQSLGLMRERIVPAASDPAVVAFARSRDPSRAEAAVAALRRVATQPEQVVATELRDASGRLLLTTAPAELALAAMATNDVIPSAEPGDSALVGRFRTWRDTLVYPVSAAVRGVDDVYVVRWRKLAGSRRSREQTTRLVGSSASVFIGNVDGPGWSDLERTVAPPPIDKSSSAQVTTYSRDGSRRLVSAAAIPGSPWMVVVDFPRDDVFAPVNAFVRRLAVIAMVALALGLLAAWRLSRRITEPLQQLTQAAESIAAGDYSQRVQLNMTDEFGVLGDAFSTMASEVQQSRDHLEHKVEERTRDLNETLAKLNDAQESLVRRERLAMLGQLSSGVGHELRNPLGVMTNAVYYLKTVLATAPANVQEYLDILQQQITLSEKIVGDLLNFARSKPPQRTPTDVLAITNAQIARLAMNDEVPVETDLPRDLPPVLVDPIHLGQIVLNLLTNAKQAVDGRGRIVVRARQLNGNVLYEVADNGPGIHMENIEKVFEPLFTTKARGIGLGLAVSRTLARANGGELAAASPPGQGATFTLTLPAAGTGA